MMTQAETSTKVIEAVSRALRKNASLVKEDSRLISDLDAESLDFLDIGFEIKQSFGREVSFKTIMTQTQQKDIRVSDIISYMNGPSA